MYVRFTLSLSSLSSVYRLRAFLESRVVHNVQDVGFSVEYTNSSGEKIVSDQCLRQSHFKTVDLCDF